MSDEAPPAKPKVLQDAEFTIDEGMLYRVSRTGAIWMNKLFFSSLVLLGVWLLMGAFGAGDAGCAETPNLVQTENGTVDDGTTQSCSVWLSPTSIYLGSMAVASFIISLGFGMLGLVVGKNIMQMTPTEEEVGAQRDDDKPT